MQKLFCPNCGINIKQCETKVGEQSFDGSLARICGGCGVSNPHHVWVRTTMLKKRELKEQNSATVKNTPNKVYTEEPKRRGRKPDSDRLVSLIEFLDPRGNGIQESDIVRKATERLHIRKERAVKVVQGLVTDGKLCQVRNGVLKVTTATTPPEPEVIPKDGSDPSLVTRFTGTGVVTTGTDPNGKDVVVVSLKNRECDVEIQFPLEQWGYVATGKEAEGSVTITRNDQD